MAQLIDTPVNSEPIGLETSHNNILIWFMKTFPNLVKSMDECSHHYDSNHINKYHIEGRVWTHTLMVFKNSQIFSPNNHYTKWSALLHDIGKYLAMDIKDEKKKKNFTGHEGISAFMALDILNKTDLTDAEKIHIFKIVALHGSLFNYIRSDGEIKKELSEMYEGNASLLKDVVLQVRNDSLGRFFDPIAVVDNDPEFTQLLPEHFESTVNLLGDDVYRGIKPHQLTILTGPPCVGKSHYITDYLSELDDDAKNNTVIISRDELVETVGKKYGQDNYSDAWKWLKLKANVKIEREEVDAELIRRVQTARREKKNVIIDQTSMSKKSRRKWINQFEKDYNKKCIVFLSGYEQQLKCNIAREKKENKRISKWVTINMIKSFTLPMYGEGFDDIEYKLVPERF